MAYIKVSAPGTQFGPCVECQHKDCAEQVKTAAQICAICNQTIGYETNFSGMPEDQSKVAHFSCIVDTYAKN